MKTILRGSVFLLLLATPNGFAGSGKYSIKTATVGAPKALAAPIKDLLGDEGIQLYEEGKLVAEVFFCKTIPGHAAADTANKTVTYKDLKETTLFGAIEIYKEWKDYRKQKIKAGVYTLRLGFQPQDGDHMGTSPHPEFLLLTAAKLDLKPDHLPIKTVVERSSTSINTTHPAVLLLYPSATPPDKIDLAAKPNNTWVINLKKPVGTQDKGTANLGIGFAVVGHTAE